MGKIVLVRPEIAENTGFIARLCGNFDWDLRLVDPSFNLKDCRGTAAGCQEVLDNARIYSDLVSALEGVDFSIGTKPGRGVGLNDFEALNYDTESLSLVLGCESRGLSNYELNLCDTAVHIETKGDYGSLNLSHAAAILMYNFSLSETSSPLSEGEKRFLADLVGEGSLLFQLLLSSGVDDSEFDKLVEELKFLMD